MQSESLRSASDSTNPTISTVLRGDELPAMIRTLLPGKPSALLKRDSTAALALPRSGGAATRTFNVAPSQPATLLREDPGTTLTVSLKLVAFMNSRDAAEDHKKIPAVSLKRFDTQERGARVEVEVQNFGPSLLPRP